MTEQKKHPNYEFIVAFAEGKQLQWWHPFVEEWVDFDWEVYNGPWAPPTGQWRVKPETRWYRVALIKSQIGELWVGTADEESDEVTLQNSLQFVRWLTDRVEYNV